ncbi:hypothetical protein Pan110_55140 [Gimesia panareensis]|nr:hypothetical protein Pan110_55140 [Gimesia panareensis]
MTRSSVPASSRWGANLCRSMCGVTAFSKPASLQASRQTHYTDPMAIGLIREGPKNSQSTGRAAHQ